MTVGRFKNCNSIYYYIKLPFLNECILAADIEGEDCYVLKYLSDG